MHFSPIVAKFNSSSLLLIVGHTLWIRGTLRRIVRLCVWKGTQIIVDRAQFVSTQRRAKVWPRHHLQEAACLRVIEVLVLWVAACSDHVDELGSRETCREAGLRCRREVR